MYMMALNQIMALITLNQNDLFKGQNIHVHSVFLKATRYFSTRSLGIFEGHSAF